MALQEREVEPLRATGKVWQIEQIANDIVAVETQKRIGVEQDRRHAADKHDVVGDRAHEAGLRMEPDGHRDSRSRKLDDHPGRADDRPLPAGREQQRGRRIDVRRRHEGQEADADLMNATALETDGIGMAEFVQDLQRRKHREEDDEAVGREHPVGHVGGKFRPVDRNRRAEPQHGPRATGGRPEVRTADAPDEARRQARGRDRTSATAGTLGCGIGSPPACRVCSPERLVSSASSTDASEATSSAA